MPGIAALECCPPDVEIRIRTAFDRSKTLISLKPDGVPDRLRRRRLFDLGATIAPSVPGYPADWTAERFAVLCGASALHADYQALLTDAQEGTPDLVLAHALDRLRRPGGVAARYEWLRFASIRIMTQAKGELSELHAAIAGDRCLLLEELAIRTHRAVRGWSRQAQR